jgi:NADH-quinone oxidoreductase subunit I
MARVDDKPGRRPATAAECAGPAPRAALVRDFGPGLLDCRTSAREAPPYMIKPFIIGFATTLRHMFKKPNSVNYPDQKVPMFPKWRGKQVLMRDEHGLEKCVACGLCAVACPADAIYLEAEENDGTVLAGPRYAKVYQIHKTRCIFCGFCEEACPVSAIFMGKDYELAVYSKDDFIWDKADLLVPDESWAPAAAPR